MGWYTGYETRQDVIADCIKQQATMKTLAHCTTGNNLWVVFERTKPDNTTLKFVCLFMIQRYGARDWGYKPVDESMGPFYYNCPESYLDMADGGEINESSKEWREQVRAFWKHKRESAAFANTLNVGDVFTVFGKKYMMERKHSRTALIGRNVETGKVYRCLFHTIRKWEAPAPVFTVTLINAFETNAEGVVVG